MLNLKTIRPVLSAIAQRLQLMFSKRTSSNSNPGLSLPLEVTPTILSSEIKQDPVLPVSESPAKLIEVPVTIKTEGTLMSANSVILSLSTIVTGISAIASGIVTVYENGQKLLDILKAAVVKVEDQFSSLKAAGATKKEIVMSTLQAAADALGESWDNIKTYFSALIDSLISVYNQAKTVVADVKTAASGETVVTTAPAETTVLASA